MSPKRRCRIFAMCCIQKKVLLRYGKLPIERSSALDGAHSNTPPPHQDARYRQVEDDGGANPEQSQAQTLRPTAGPFHMTPRTAVQKQLLHFAKAHVESAIKPHRMRHDFWRKTVALVANHGCVQPCFILAGARSNNWGGLT